MALSMPSQSRYPYRNTGKIITLIVRLKLTNTFALNHPVGSICFPVHQLGTNAMSADADIFGAFVFAFPSTSGLILSAKESYCFDVD